jgi:hypothetical protein
MRSQGSSVPSSPCPLGSLGRIVLAASSLLVFPAIACAQASCATQAIPGGGIRGTDYMVHATTMWDPDGVGPLSPLLVVGGSFSIAGNVLANLVATYDEVSGTWGSLGSLPSGTVQALATMANGDLVVARNSVVERWNGTNFSTLGFGGQSVLCMATLPNGDLVVGGDFTAMNGVPAIGVARWDGTNWWPLGGGAGGVVRSLAVLQNGNIVAGGDFNTAGGVTAYGVALWNGVAWSSMGFPNSQWGNSVHALAVMPSGTLVAGGDFTTSGIDGIAQWNGTTWAPMGTAMFGVRGLRVRANGELLAVGGFSARVARWSGTSWLGIGSGLSVLGTVQAVTELPSGNLVAGGTGVFNATANFVKKWNGTMWSDMSPGFNSAIEAVHALPNGDIIVGGAFTTAGAINANRIARWNGANWVAMGTGMFNNSVKALASLPNGNVVAAGSFTTANATGTSRIAQWNGTSWAAMGSGFNNTVNVLLSMPNGDLIAGGGFTAAGAVSASYVARWNGSVWAPLGSGPGGAVHDLTVMANGDIVAANSANGASRWNGVSWSSVSGILPVDLVQKVFGLPNGDLLVQGGFLNNSVWMARWNGSTWTRMDAGFTSIPTVSQFSLLPNGDVLASGSFVTNSWSASMMRWSGSSWAPVPLSANGWVSCFAMANTDIVFGGSFTVINGSSVSAYFGRLTTTCPATATSSGAGCNSSVGPMSLTANTLPWIGGTFRSTCTGIAPLSLSFGLLGFTSPGTPLSLLHPQGGIGCNLLANPDATMLLLPTGGQVTSQFSLATSPAFVGVVLHHQVLQVELDPTLQITQIGSSNGIALTMGVF